MSNAPLVHLLENKLPTVEGRKREVEFFKRDFNLANLLEFFDSNGFIAGMRKLPTPDDRFFYFARALEEYYQRPDIDFGLFILNKFQREHPEFDFGMCPQLSIYLGKVGYIKLCSPPGRDSFKVYCTGFRFDSCKDYKK